MIDDSNAPTLYTADGDDAAPILRSMRFRWWPYVVLVVIEIAIPNIYLLTRPSKVTDITAHTILVGNGGVGLSSLTNVDFFHHEYTVRPAPPDHPTPRILIDGDVITVHYGRRSEFLRYGCTAESWYGGEHPNMIWLPDDADSREIRESMIHELMHFALRKAGGEMQDPLNADRPVGSGGESVINPTARIMVDIFRDNPKLVEWLRNVPR